MKKEEEMQTIGDIFVNRKKTPKAPAYQWQELALKVINELGIPNFKKSSVFKACRDNSKNFVEKCFNDTKELCGKGEKWKYFFKIIGGKK